MVQLGYSSSVSTAHSFHLFLLRFLCFQLQILGHEFSFEQSPSTVVFTCTSCPTTFCQINLPCCYWRISLILESFTFLSQTYKDQISVSQPLSRLDQRCLRCSSEHTKIKTMFSSIFLRVYQIRTTFSSVLLGDHKLYSVFLGFFFFNEEKLKLIFSGQSRLSGCFQTFQSCQRICQAILNTN